MIRYMLMISYIRGQNSRHMNPFEIERGESFIIGDSDLRELLDRPYKSGYGMILFCYKGTANISVDLSRWDIRRNTVIVFQGTIYILFEGLVRRGRIPAGSALFPLHKG